MRTTVSLDADVAAAVQRLRAQRGIGLSEAINELVRAALVAPAQRGLFVQRTLPVELTVDVTNVAEALEQLDGPSSR